MKVLITGGKGYIARNLVPLFENGGYEVVAPSRTEMDLLNEEQTEEVLYRERPDVLIHAATRGGRRTHQDTWDDVFVPNMKMWETISHMSMNPGIGIGRIILIGSGAEFDRRYPIDNAMECLHQYAFPLDPYGLSKNLITHQALETFEHTYVLRLFGCFNFDDDPSRFIKASILNLKRGLPIEVHQNREMSYFYLDDVFTVMDYILKSNHAPRDINLVYPEKLTLLDIAKLIQKYVINYHPPVKLNTIGMADPYTGDGDILSELSVTKDLIGLEEGIRRTVHKLS